MSATNGLVLSKEYWLELKSDKYGTERVRANVKSLTPKKTMVTLTALENTREVIGLPPDPALFCCGQSKKFEVAKEIRVIEAL